MYLNWSSTAYMHYLFDIINTKYTYLHIQIQTYKPTNNTNKHKVIQQANIPHFILPTTLDRNEHYHYFTGKKIEGQSLVT